MEVCLVSHPPKPALDALVQQIYTLLCSGALFSYNYCPRFADSKGIRVSLYFLKLGFFLVLFVLMESLAENIGSKQSSNYLRPSVSGALHRGTEDQLMKSLGLRGFCYPRCVPELLCCGAQGRPAPFLGAVVDLQNALSGHTTTDKSDHVKIVTNIQCTQHQAVFSALCIFLLFILVTLIKELFRALYMF